MFSVDVVVVGAGPGGGTAARVAAAEGVRVLLVEQRPTVGLPVQCAEYVPAQVVEYARVPEHCIRARIRTLRTHLPDGETVETPAAGYVLDRAAFDKALAVAANRAGAEVWTGTRAVERTERGIVVRQRGKEVEIECRVVVGADGPRSTVGRWIGQTNAGFIDGLQVEAVLPTFSGSGLPSTGSSGLPSTGSSGRCTEVYFDPTYRGGYGWLFPKGETANVGVGVNRGMGGEPRQALEHLLARLEIAPGAILGRTAGPVPSGGTVASIRVGNVLLVGDAAGHTHPVTGAGIFAAVVSGTLAGRAAARAVRGDDLAALDEYEREWNAFMGGPLRHALTRRRHLDEHWSDDAAALSGVVRETWVAFKGYGRRQRR